MQYICIRTCCIGTGIPYMYIVYLQFTIVHYVYITCRVKHVLAMMQESVQQMVAAFCVAD